MTSAGESVVKTRPYAGFTACLRGSLGRSTLTVPFMRLRGPIPRRLAVRAPSNSAATGEDHPGVLKRISQHVVHWLRFKYLAGFRQPA